jgi:phage major head subunit gpT-like protein
MGMEYLTQREVIGSYYKALNMDEGIGWVNSVSNLFRSDQASEVYAWLGQSPMMREWIGGRNAKGLRESNFTIVNKHYEATLDILKRNLRRDKSGQAMVRIAELARRSNSHWASLLSTLIAGGASTDCYDGTYFFATDHSEGSSGTQSNSITVDISELPVAVDGTTTVPSVENMQFCIMHAIQAIVSFKDDQGEPMNADARGFLVFCPISLWMTALNAVATPLQVDASQTALQGARQQGFSIRVEPDPRSAWTANFAVFRTDSPIKSFIRQEEQAVELAMKWLDSEYCFDNDAIQIGIDAWRNVGYGYWQNSCLVTMG